MIIIYADDDDHVVDDVDDDDDYDHDFSGKVCRLLHHHQCLCPGQNSQVRSVNLKPKMTNGAKWFFQPFLPLHHGGHVGDDADVDQVQRKGVGGKESDQQL